MKTNGTAFKKYEINIGKGVIGTATQAIWHMEWHQFIEVIKEGKSIIFDNMNPGGIAKEEYIKMIAGRQSNSDKVIEGAELLSKYAKEIN